MSLAAERDLLQDSLVGSFFLSDESRGWQGCVVAEPAPGRYLVELFGWIGGDSTCQEMVSLDQMIEWKFYDSANWMRNDYEYSVAAQWEHIRKVKTDGDES